MEANETALKQTHKLVNKNLQFLAVTNKTLVSSCAVRCVYVYCDVWNSHESEELVFFVRSKQFVWHVCNPIMSKKLWKYSWILTEKDFLLNRIPHRKKIENNNETIKYTLWKITVILRRSRDSLWSDSYHSK